MTDSQTPPTEAAFFTTIRGWGLTRAEDGVLGGVVAGLAHRLHWSLGWTRVGVVVGALILSGIVLIAYAAAWALLPDRQGRIIAQDFGRGVPNVGALIGIGVIGIIGLIGLGDRWGPWQAGPWSWDDIGAFDGGGVLRAFGILMAVLVPIVIVGGVITLIVVLTRRNRDQGAPRPDGEPPLYAQPPAWAAERQRQRAEATQAAVDAAERAGREAEAAGVAAGAAAAEAAEQAQRAAHEATQAAPTWAAPAAQAPPPVPPRPPRPPRVPGPGAAFGLLTLAWLVISAATVAAAEWQDQLAVHPLAAWFALFFTGLGVILVLVALTGRRLGFLAFLSAVLLVPAAVMIAGAEGIRDGWQAEWLPEIHVERDGDEVTRVEIGDGDLVFDVPRPAESEQATSAASPTSSPAEEQAPVDAIGALDDTYSLLVVPSGCYAGTAVDAAGASRGLVAPGVFTGERNATARAEVTTVRIPTGTGLAFELEDDATAVLVWDDRGFSCDIDAGGGVAALTPGEPLLTLDVEADVRTIVIEEVAR